MSIISSTQGAVKLSEVATDNSQALLNTAEREDALTVIEQLRRVTTDALRRIGLILTSRNVVTSTPGVISWTGTQLQFTANTNIILKLLQNETNSVIDLVLTYGPSNGAQSFNSVSIPNGNILYLELDRNSISSGPVTIENATLSPGGSLVSGKTARVSSSLPSLVSTSINPSTLLIPLMINIDGALWNIPHGIYWPIGTSSPLGAVVTSTTMPVGAVIPFHTFGASSPISYVATKTIAPGWQLANGSIVTDPLSVLKNATRNDDGTPGLGFNSALDNFTPNLIGLAPSWSNAKQYYIGDYVTQGVVEYVCKADNINNTPPNATYWDDPVSNSNSPYRKTSQNSQKNTYLRGNSTSYSGDSSSGYGGENAHTLTQSELPTHTHGAGLLVNAALVASSGVASGSTETPSPTTTNTPGVNVTDNQVGTESGAPSSPSTATTTATGAIGVASPSITPGGPTPPTTGSTALTSDNANTVQTTGAENISTASTPDTLASATTSTGGNSDNTAAVGLSTDISNPTSSPVALDTGPPGVGDVGTVAPGPWPTGMPNESSGQTHKHRLDGVTYTGNAISWNGLTAQFGPNEQFDLGNYLHFVYTGYDQAINTTYANTNHTHNIPTGTGPGSHTHNPGTHVHSNPAHNHAVSHSHSIPAHSHSMNAHVHSLQSHTHPHEHYHRLGHTHTISGHSHNMPHTHDMSHTHDISNHTHGLNSHTHNISHTHGLSNHTHGLNNHTHGLNSHTHNIDHNHTISGNTENGSVSGLASLPHNNQPNYFNALMIVRIY